MAEVLVWFRKEWRTEVRGRHGLLTSGLFGLVSVASVGLSMANRTVEPPLAAGLMAVLLLFVGVVALPRLFLLEDDLRTMELALLLARPSVIFGGKVLFGVLQMVVLGVLLCLVASALLGLNPDFVTLCLAATVASATTAIGLSAVSALAVGAANRWIVAAAVGLPLLLPQVVLSQRVIYAALSESAPVDFPRELGGLLLFAVALLAMGSWVVERVLEPTPRGNVE